MGPSNHQRAIAAAATRPTKAATPSSHHRRRGLGAGGLKDGMSMVRRARRRVAVIGRASRVEVAWGVSQGNTAAASGPYREREDETALDSSRGRRMSGALGLVTAT